MAPITFAPRILFCIPLLFGAIIYAQSPSQTFTPGSPTCSNGFATPASPSGVYTDVNGAQWNVQCGQDNTGVTYDSEGTQGHGFAACWNGCDERPSCTGFSFIGSVTGATSGSGICYYKSSQGSYYTNTSFYGAANLISNGTPQLPCPYYNGTTFQNSDGSVWQIYCAFDSSNPSLPSGGNGPGMPSCMTQCNANNNCAMFTYNYGNGASIVPTSSTASVVASSSTASSSSVSVSSYTGSVTPYTGPTITTTTTAASSSTQVCTGTPSPNTLPTDCTGALAGTGLLGKFTDACGSQYTIYCGNDTSPGSTGSATASSLAQCMQACDNYPNCRSATYGGGVNGVCYLKNSFSGVVASGQGNLAALVKIIPAPAGYVAPSAAGGVNTSSGCGMPLMSGLSPGGPTTLINFNNPSDGLLRNYTIHIPQSYNVTAASPLILAFPGHGETATNIEAETGFSDSGNNPYGIVAYINPYGNGMESNPDYQPGHIYGYVDDIGFVRNLIQNLTASYCIDTGRILATGFSNGAGFVNVLACDPTLSKTIAVFAPHSVAAYPNLTSGDPATEEPLNTLVQSTCSPGRNTVPMIEFHGTGDGTINYYGGGHNGYNMPTIPHWATDWALRQGYDATNYSSTLAPLPAATGTPGINVYQFGGSQGQLGIVTHYQIAGWGHEWSNPVNDNKSPLNAAPIVMSFFYRFTDPNRLPTFNPPNSSTSSSSMLSTSTVSSSTVSSSSSVPASTTRYSSSAGSSSTLSSSTSTATPTETAVAFGCPAANGQTVTENGQNYVIGCSSHVSGNATGNGTATNSFNDCFLGCDATTNCTGFAYRGAANGAGAGTCYYRNATTLGFISNDTSRVGAVRAANFVTFSTTTTGSSSSSIAMSQSSSTVASTSASTTSSGFSSGMSTSISASSSTSSSTLSSSIAFTSASTSASPTSTASSSGMGMSTSSSSSLSAAASSSGPPVCQNNTIYTDGNGVAYNLYCSADSNGGSAFSGPSISPGYFTDCMALCDKTANCATIVWVPQGPGGVCYMKAAPQTVKVLQGSNNVAAFMVSGGSSSSTASSASTSSSLVSSGSSSTSGIASSSTSGIASSSTSTSVAGSSSSMTSSLASIGTSTSSSAASSRGSTSSAATSLSASSSTVSASFISTTPSISVSTSGMSTSCASAVTVTVTPPASSTITVTVSTSGVTTVSASGSASISGTSTSASAAASSTAPSAATTNSASGSASMATTSTTSSAAASSSAASLQCPASNGTTYTDANNNQYIILCDMDTNPSASGGNTQTSFAACVNACSSMSNPSCVAVTYLGGYCYYKSAFTSAKSGLGADSAILLSVYNGGSSSASSSSSLDSSASSPSSAAASPNNAASASTSASVAASSSPAGSASSFLPGSSSAPLNSASSSMVSGSTAASNSVSAMGMSSTSSSAAASSSAATASCPSSNGTTYTDASGAQYMILCDYDTAPSSYNSFAVANFPACISACSANAATTPACVASTFLGDTCYLKSAYASAFSATGRQTAVLLSAYIPTGSFSSSSIGSSTAPGQSSTAGSSSVAAPPSYGGSSTVTSTGSSSIAVGSSIGVVSSVSSTAGDQSSAILSSSAAAPPSYGGSSTAVSTTPSSAASSQVTSMTPGQSSTSASSSSASAPPSYGSSTAAAPTTASSSSMAGQSSPPAMSVSGPSTSIQGVSSNAASASALSSAPGVPSGLSAGMSITPSSSMTNTPSATSSGAVIISSGTVIISSGTVVVSSGAVAVPSSTPVGVQSSSAPASPPAPYPSSSSLQSSVSAAGSSSVASIMVTTSAPASQLISPPSSTAMMSSSSTSTLPACPSATCGSQTNNSTACADPYGNSFNVSCNTQYTGAISMRAAKANLNACLTACDISTNCVAVNYFSSGECDLFSMVNGTETVPGAGAQAATRPGDVSTVYSTPPATSMTAASTSSSSGGSMSNNGGPGPVSGGSISGVVAASLTVAAGSSYTATSFAYSPSSSPFVTTNNPNHTPSSSAGGAGVGSSMQGGGQGGTSYASMSANAGISSSSYGTMSNPNLTPSSSAAVGASFMPAGGSSNGVSGSYMATTNYQSTPIATVDNPFYTPNSSGNPPPPPASSSPAISGTVTAPYSLSTVMTPTASPICPAYNNETYTNADGSTYQVQCDTAYQGTVIAPTSANSDSHKLLVLRQQQSTPPYNPITCMLQCDQTPSCIAITVTDFQCTLYSALTGSEAVHGATALLKVQTSLLTASVSVSVSVVTMSVCVAGGLGWGTTTVFTTATVTACGAQGAVCTAGGGSGSGRLGEGFIGMFGV